MKRLMFAFILALAFCCAVSFISFERECGEIRGSVLRLHIIADSDSLEDQTLKLLVRDRILADSDGLFTDALTLDEAEKSAAERLSEIQSAAEDELRKNGCNDAVTVELGESWFPTRTYGNVTLPAGKYSAVRVMLGSAKGHNWWCVLFPMMCVPGASAETELEDVLTDEQLEIVSDGGYEVRFKCVELYERWIEDIREKQQRIAVD